VIIMYEYRLTKEDGTVAESSSAETFEAAKEYCGARSMQDSTMGYEIFKDGKTVFFTRPSRSLFSGFWKFKSV
jgi:hypothetical protein